MTVLDCEIRTWQKQAEDLLIDVPECPELKIQDALKRAWQDFCVETGVWQMKLDPIYTAEDVYNYEIWPPDGTRVHLIMWIRDRKTDHPERFSFRPPNKVELIRGDEKGERHLDLLVSLKPDRKEGEGVPVFLVDSHGDAVESGALWRLYRVPGQPWTNPELADYHRKVYRAGVVGARVDHQRGYYGGVRTVRRRQWL